MDKQEFIEYLTTTLIPDLRADGKHFTAADFEAAVLFMQGAEEIKFKDDKVIKIR